MLNTQQRSLIAKDIQSCKKVFHSRYCKVAAKIAAFQNVPFQAVARQDPRVNPALVLAPFHTKNSNAFTVMTSSCLTP